MRSKNTIANFKNALGHDTISSEQNNESLNTTSIDWNDLDPVEDDEEVKFDGIEDDELKELAILS